MKQVTSSSHGIKWGLIIGVVYWLLLFLRYKTGGDNAVMFGLLTAVGFIAVVILLFVVGFRFRKEAGGYAEMKELFKTMFIAVLIFEAFYAVFTFVYISVIDPAFFSKLRLSTETLLTAAGQPQSKIDEVMSQMDKQIEQSKHFTIFDYLKSYLYYVGITGLFALLFAFILKRKPVFTDQDNFQSSNSN